MVNKQKIFKIIKNEKIFINLIFMFGFVFLALGSFILPIELNLTPYEFTLIDGILLIIFGYILLFISIKIYIINKNHKWYEDIKHNEA